MNNPVTFELLDVLSGLSAVLIPFLGYLWLQIAKEKTRRAEVEKDVALLQQEVARLRNDHDTAIEGFRNDVKEIRALMEDIRRDVQTWATKLSEQIFRKLASPPQAE